MTMLLFIVALYLLAWRFQKPSTTLGSAAWLTIFQAMKKGLFRRKGILVGDWTGLLRVYYNGVHSVTYGAAGSGKGTTAILPNALTARRLFLYDPGGENTAVAIRQWRLEGYETYVVNPFDQHCDKPWSLPSDGFNPFDFLVPGAPALSADAKMLATTLIPRSGHEGSNTSYFKDQAEAWLTACITFIVETEPAAERNLGTLYDFANLPDKDWEALNKAMAGAGHAMATTLLEKWKDAPPEYSAITGTIKQHLQFLAEPKTRAALCRSDVNFEALKDNQRGAIIAVVLPISYKVSHAAIPRLAMQCAVWAMTRGTPSPHQVLFEIDEAASLGRVEMLPQWLAELRKYKVQWSLHFQNVGQPKHLYRAEWQVIQGNAGLKRFIGVRDVETAQELASYLGRQTIAVRTHGPGGVSIAETARELRTVEEILSGDSRYQVVLMDNLKPLLLRKTEYWNRPEFAGRYWPNPYVEKPKGLSAATPFRWVWGRFVYALAWLLTPHPVAALLIIATLAAWILLG